jgi:hypothetical protein
MLRFIFAVLVIMTLAAVIGVDCLTCGYGETIRSNIHKTF